MKKLIESHRRKKLRKFAKTFSAEIKDRFGKKILYPADEIDEVAASIGVTNKQREWAYGMFAEEAACQGFLSRIGSSRTARELRIFMAGSMFGAGSSVGYESMWNRFDDPDDTVIGGLSNASGGSSGGHSGDSGDSDYDSGGFDGGSSD